METNEKITFTSSEICVIMRECIKLGVKNFECGSLKFSLRDRAIGIPGFGARATPPAGDAIPGPHPKGDAIPLKDPKKLKAELIEREEIALREEEIAMSTIENPQLAEQLLNDEELEDADSDEFEQFDE